jgi:hypothetical protein
VAIEVYTAEVGGRQFLVCGEVVSIPVDRIKRFDFKIPNGGASDRSVQIVTDDPDEEIIFAFEKLDAIANFLKQDTGFPMGR